MSATDRATFKYLGSTGRGIREVAFFKSEGNYYRDAHPLISPAVNGVSEHLERVPLDNVPPKYRVRYPLAIKALEMEIKWQEQKIRTLKERLLFDRSAAEQEIKNCEDYISELREEVECLKNLK